MPLSHSTFTKFIIKYTSYAYLSSSFYTNCFIC